jgi:ketopantoate reductase
VKVLAWNDQFARMFFSRMRAMIVHVKSGMRDFVKERPTNREFLRLAPGIGTR